MQRVYCQVGNSLQALHEKFQNSQTKINLTKLGFQGQLRDFK